MSYFHLTGGILLILFGGYITLKQIKVYRRRQQDDLGFDMRLLVGGISFVFVGIALLARV